MGRRNRAAQPSNRVHRLQSESLGSNRARTKPWRNTPANPHFSPLRRSLCWNQTQNKSGHLQRHPHRVVCTHQAQAAPPRPNPSPIGRSVGEELSTGWPTECPPNRTQPFRDSVTPMANKPGQGAQYKRQTSRRIGISHPRQHPAGHTRDHQPKHNTSETQRRPTQRPQAHRSNAADPPDSGLA